MTDHEDDYRSRGGLARKEKLTPEQRSEIARNAARAKWDSKSHKRCTRAFFRSEMQLSHALFWKMAAEY